MIKSIHVVTDDHFLLILTHAVRHPFLPTGKARCEKLKHQLKLGCQVGTPLSCQEPGKKKIANTHLHVACEGGIEGKRAGLLGVNPNPNKTGANR